MSKIEITNGVSVLFDVQPNPISSITKYIPGLDHIALQTPAFVDLLEKPVGEIPKDAAIKTGLSIEQPVPIDAKNLKLSISAELSGSLGHIRSAGEHTPLLDSDPADEKITFEGKQCYMCVGLNASVSAGLKARASQFNFGIEPGTAATLTYYQRFEPDPEKTQFKELVGQAIAGFMIPARLDDLKSMPEGSVATVDHDGTLKLAANADLLALSNPLASLELPAGIGTVGVNAGAKVTVAASFEVTGGHQIRVHKCGPDQVTIGYYRKTGFNQQYGVTASAGVTADLGKTELFSLLFDKLAPNSGVDPDALKKAGLNGKQIAAIRDAVKAGIDRKLQVSLSDQLSLLSSHEAAFLYRVDLSKLKDTAGLERALHGDLRDFAGEGIKEAKSIFTETGKRRIVVKFNLVGILNGFSVNELVTKGKIVVDDDKGEITVLDQASASRVRGLVNNFRLNDGGRQSLRRLLAESFLISAVYLASAKAAGPRLNVEHSFFKLSQSANQHVLEDHVALAHTLNLPVPKELDDLLHLLDEFGLVMAEAKTSYGPETSESLFLDSDHHARRVDEYEEIGRQALLAVVRTGDIDDWRRIPCEDPVLFDQMNRIGNVNDVRFKALFSNLKNPDLQIRAIGTDFLTIRWWSDSMRRLGERLEEMRTFLASPANKDINLKTNRRFQKVRDQLAAQLKHVTDNTSELFGEPWGLVAMYMASGGKAASSMRIMNAKLPGGLYLGEHGEPEIPADPEEAASGAAAGSPAT
jgi:hypothetical protein